ncbi:hypothetical protein C8F04DRAFT_1183042 [Mycena alexandri]|uniref:Uncharacterized protein n=1 Tax=Mycena alexandri TaxID=1745969 RepID=A0AAD6SVY2_9AGAR|nr:hypothetical protein C8F04DRAFT_1183042 [Mycena alexandri]
MAKIKNDESHAPRRKTVLAGHGTTRRNTKQRLQNIVSMLSLQQKKKWEVVHLGTKQSLQHEEDANQWAVLNHHCSIGCRSTGEETIFKQMSLLQAAKGNMPVQKGIEGYILLQGRGFQENFAKEIINRSPPMCTKSHTSGKLAHSVHDQRSVEYVGPILSSLSQLHGGFMQWTGHRELSRRAKLYQLEPRPFNDHMRTLLCQCAFRRPKMCCYCSSYYVPGRPNLCQFNSSRCFVFLLVVPCPVGSDGQELLLASSSPARTVLRLGSDGQEQPAGLYLPHRAKKSTLNRLWLCFHPAVITCFKHCGGRREQGHSLLPPPAVGQIVLELLKLTRVGLDKVKQKKPYNRHSSIKSININIYVNPQGTYTWNTAQVILTMTAFQLQYKFMQLHSFSVVYLQEGVACLNPGVHQPNPDPIIIE